MTGQRRRWPVARGSARALHRGGAGGRAGAGGETAGSTWLSGARRARELAQLADGAEVIDVLVVGGGVTGTGVALDAASRGLSVALVERGDLGSGTSHASSKLIHGGLRYLAGGDVGLALASAQERDLLMRTLAPHLIRALPMLAPLGSGLSRPEGLLMAAGEWAGELLRVAAGTPQGVLPRPRRIGPAEARRLAPTLRSEGLRGGLVSWEGQLEDDVRLVVALARTAAGYGARILTRCAATEVDAGGALLADTLGGGRFEVRARHVVNAAGAWAGTLDPRVHLRPSKGSHLVLRAAALGFPTAAIMVPVPHQGSRFVFALPQPDGLIYLGLTDDELAGAVPDVLEVTPAERDFLLATVSTVLDRPLAPNDVIGSFAGVRPLLSGASARTADLSRHHSLVGEAGGVLTVTGGKLTTYRRMAADVVDRLTVVPGRTAHLPLVGAAGLGATGAGCAGGPGLPRRLVRRYGCEAADVAALAAHQPDLLEPVAPGLVVLGAEFAWGVLAEGALTADDLLARRTRLTLVAGEAAAARAAAEGALAQFGDATAPVATSLVRG